MDLVWLLCLQKGVFGFVFVKKTFKGTSNLKRLAPYQRCEAELGIACPLAWFCSLFLCKLLGFVKQSLWEQKVFRYRIRPWILPEKSMSQLSEKSGNNESNVPPKTVCRGQRGELKASLRDQESASRQGPRSEVLPCGNPALGGEKALKRKQKRG